MINANQVVNSLGPTFVSQLAGRARRADLRRRARVPDRARGDRRARRAGRRSSGSAASVDRATVTELMAGVDRLVEAVARWYLAHRPGADLGGRSPPAEGFERLRRRARPRSATTPGASAARRGRRAAHRARACRRTSRAPTRSRRELAQAADMIATAARHRAPGRGGHARAFYVLGAAAADRLAARRARRARGTTRTQRWALHAVRDDAWARWSELVRRALRSRGARRPRRPLTRSSNARAVQARRLASVTRSLSVDGTSDLPALMLAVRCLRSLA